MLPPTVPPPLSPPHISRPLNHDLVSCPHLLQLFLEVGGDTVVGGKEYGEVLRLLQ